MNETYYIVRADRAGVFADNIKERNGFEVILMLKAAIKDKAVICNE